MAYANKTKVEPEKSRADIEAVLVKYGAAGFRYSWFEENEARIHVIEFLYNKRMIRFSLSIEGGLTAQRTRSKWRSLLLNIKAKVDAVESGISQFETEFLAYTVNSSTNRTVAEEVLPMLENADHSGAFRIEHKTEGE